MWGNRPTRLIAPYNHRPIAPSGIFCSQRGATEASSMWPVIDAINMCLMCLLCHVLIFSFAGLLITTSLTLMYRQRLTSKQYETCTVDFLPHRLRCALLLLNEVTPI